MMGLVRASIRAAAIFPFSSKLRRLSSEERLFSNSEMSAPETKARSPAPRMTTTRTSPRSSKASKMTGSASVISSETALRRSGLL